MKNKCFPIVLYSEATPQVKAIYDDVMTHFELDFVLNYFKAQGSNLGLLKGNWEKIKSVFFQGSVSRLIKEEIIYRISKQQNCQYCSYVHTKVIESLRNQIQELQGINKNPQFTKAEESAIKLILIMAFESDAGMETYYDKLIALGFTEEQIPELLAVVDLTFMLNKQAQMYGIEIDEEFLQNKTN